MSYDGNRELSITLTIYEINTILLALQEVQFKIANPIMKKIEEQSNAQLVEPSLAFEPDLGAEEIE